MVDSDLTVGEAGDCGWRDDKLVLVAVDVESYEPVGQVECGGLLVTEIELSRVGERAVALGGLELDVTICQGIRSVGGSDRATCHAGAVARTAAGRVIVKAGAQNHVQ